MKLTEYLKSKAFFVRVAMALGIVIIAGFLVLQWLDFTTNHGQEISVPDLSKLSVEAAEEKLDDADLDYEILDTVDFVPGYPKYSIVSQDPAPGDKVKEDRKIYLKVNSAGYSSTRVPDLIEKTYRNAQSILQSAGLQEGKITYKPYLGKDMVLEMRQGGKLLHPGDKIMKASKIDLVLGDGKVGFEDTDSTDVTTDSIPE
ncbi:MULTISPECIES: PASTA domain-containing protein [unclassified Flavobacterium]|uniref:PASTA domain-containing protein n=1 Tax=unclassified Flavobacterium TaxID=196869 RepID=UPI001F12C91E|nr:MULTISPECIES: PASTA domain-containing protein [unclassified Flavobacterium]UMY64881.1 PASTA domain-containing protein [Flavobacterium sp. HJ-32-4]